MTPEAKEFAAQFQDSATRILWHYSPEEFVEFLKQDRLYKFGVYSYPTDGTWNGASFKTAVEKIIWGDDTRAQMAQKLFDKIIASDQITIGRNEIRPAIVGYVPNVPAALAGQPETMLTRVITDNFSSTAPIRIFFDIGVSGGVGLPELIKRGVAALALTMVTKQFRPIELYCFYSYLPYFAGYGAAINVIRIETSPLDLMRASWMMTDNAMVRSIGITLSNYMFQDRTDDLYYTCHRGTDWGWCSSPRSSEYQDNVRQALDIQPQDILIVGGHLFDKLMLNDPVTWINQQVQNIRQLAEE